MNRSEQILQAARDLARACFDARAAKKARNAWRCEFSKNEIFNTDGSLVDHESIPRRTQENPCWSNWQRDSEHEPAYLPERESWCASCIQREQPNRAYREAMQRRGRALRQIQANYRAEVRA